MSNDNFPENDKPLEHDDPIQPVEFVPHTGKKKKALFQLRPAQIAIVSVLLIFAITAWYVVTAKSIFFDVYPLESSIEVNGGLAIQIGSRYLVREGEIEVTVRHEGYYDFSTPLTVTEQQAQSFSIELTRLPGFLNLDTGDVNDARVFIDGELAGTTPLQREELAAGEHSIRLEKERYQPWQGSIDMEGRQTEQSMSVSLIPAWANISFNSAPEGASVLVDGEEVGTTPLTAEILQGSREVIVKLPAYKAWTESLEIIALQDQQIPLIELVAADGLVLLQSTPSNAGVTLDGQYQGQTPLEISVPPGEERSLRFFLSGHEELQRVIQTEPDQELSLNVTLDPIVSLVQIVAEPQDAQLYINGEHAGPANQTVELLAASQEIEIRRDGYVPYTTTFISNPGLEQRLSVELKTLAQQRRESIKQEITAVSGQKLKLLYPGSFTMGASRREAGRQANEILREVTLANPFYLSLTEVTNAQFKQFDPEHSSGTVASQTLSNNNQPVVRISWEQAALYCNWLSEQESLPLFYNVEDGRVTGFNPDSTGYRLPTEAEWAWAARYDNDPANLLKFPWGPELPPPNNHGNYADLTSAAVLGRIINNYNDSFLATAPVASFPANQNGFFDMGGNVVEWVHDFYGAVSQMRNAENQLFGPEDGNYHVIRGSSWAHGSITELRLSYRDYGNDTRDDVGFRIARTLEPIE